MTIDWWTLGLQTVNVLVLIWLLQRFFWRPVAAMIAARRAQAATLLADAQSKRDAADAALADIAKTRAGFAQERAAIMAEAHESAARTQATAHTDAQKDIVVLKQAARTALEEERQAAEKALDERAGRLAVEIAAKLVARLDDAAVRSAFLDWLTDAIGALPDGARNAVTDGSTLEVVSAAPLEAADQDKCRLRIGKVLGCHPEITFTTDPALIAGLELKGEHLQVANSWRADLARILAELDHDRQH